MNKYYLYIGVKDTEGHYTHEIKMTDFWKEKKSATQCLNILKFIYRYIMKSHERITK